MNQNLRLLEVVCIYCAGTVMAWSFFENIGGTTRVHAYCPVCKTRYTREVKETKELPDNLGV